MICMEKDVLQSSKLQPYADLSVIREKFIVDENTLFVQPHHKLWSIINIKNITTPMISLPLNVGMNRIFKRVFDIIFSVLVIIGVLSWLIPVISILIWIEGTNALFAVISATTS